MIHLRLDILSLFSHCLTQQAHDRYWIGHTIISVPVKTEKKKRKIKYIHTERFHAQQGNWYYQLS